MKPSLPKLDLSKLDTGSDSEDSQKTLQLPGNSPEKVDQTDGECDMLSAAVAKQLVVASPNPEPVATSASAAPSSEPAAEKAAKTPMTPSTVATRDSTNDPTMSEARRAALASQISDAAKEIKPVRKNAAKKTAAKSQGKSKKKTKNRRRRRRITLWTLSLRIHQPAQLTVTKTLAFETRLGVRVCDKDVP